MLKFIIFISLVGIINACANTQSVKIDSLHQQTVQLTDAFRLIAEEKIPSVLLKKSEAIIISDITKTGLFLGLEGGKGILTIRNQKKWSNPIFINILNISLGLMAGIEVQKLVLVFTSSKEAEQFVKGNSKICFALNVTIGPLTNEVTTDTIFDQNVYYYTSGVGIFGGISLKTTSLSMDNAANRELYGKTVSFDDFYNGNHKKLAIALNLENTLKEIISE